MKKINFSKKTKWITLLKYIFIFGLFYVFSCAGVNGKVFCFGFGLLFALVWCNQNVFITSALYIGASVLANLNVNSLVYATSTVLLLLIFYGIHIKIKKPMKPLLVGLYALLSQAPTVFLQIYNGGNIIITFISLVLGVLFMFACLKFITALFIKGIKFKLTVMETLCGCCMLVVLGMGLSNIAPYDIEIIKFISTFLILGAFYTFGSSTSLIFAGMLGIGSLLALNNVMYLAIFMLWAFGISIFKVKNKFIPVLALLATELCLGFAFQLYYSYTYMSVISVIAGCFVFLCVPETIFHKINSVFETSKDKIAMKNIVNRSRETMCRRLNELSEVFSDMDKVFRAMIKGGLTPEDAKQVLLSEIKDKVCSDCPEKRRCHRTFADETNEVFDDLVNRAFQKGKSTLLDIPPFLTARCSRLNMLVSTINTLSQQYKKYTGMMTSMDTSRILVAEQLGGVSKIMKNLASEVNRNISFDYAREERIIDELAYVNVNCCDVAIYEQNVDIVSVTLIISEENFYKQQIETAVSKICNHKLQIVNHYASTMAGMLVVTLKTACKNDIIFGVASAKKQNSDKNGDSFSVVRIESDKIMLALCDGMGSGEQAEKTSHLAIGLVENFYKAGFDSETILSSVNKLLALGKDENFSALDLCVLDIRKCVCDFIKLGAPCGYIKHEQTTEIIESGALPLGIVNEMKPMIKKTLISSGDFVIICTDGISDAFEDDNALRTLINNIEIVNPQMIADFILAEAKKKCLDRPSDDMTVLVCRLI